MYCEKIKFIYFTTQSGKYHKVPIMPLVSHRRAERIK